uniref:Uncharacterized protein n=1 Tax=Cacopsylla melanoneura TaxID=428564 RepID=A0A8D9ALG0_9HEMI
MGIINFFLQLSFYFVKIVHDNLYLPFLLLLHFVSCYSSTNSSCFPQLLSYLFSLSLSSSSSLSLSFSFSLSLPLSHTAFYEYIYVSNEEVLYQLPLFFYLSYLLPSRSLFPYLLNFLLSFFLFLSCSLSLSLSLLSSFPFFFFLNT